MLNYFKMHCIWHAWTAYLKCYARPLLSLNVKEVLDEVFSKKSSWMRSPNIMEVLAKSREFFFQVSEGVVLVLMRKRGRREGDRVVKERCEFLTLLLLALLKNTKFISRPSIWISEGAFLEDFFKFCWFTEPVKPSLFTKFAEWEKL